MGKKIARLLMVMLTAIGVTILVIPHLSKDGRHTDTPTPTPEITKPSMAQPSNALVQPEEKTDDDAGAMGDLAGLEGLVLDAPESMARMSNPSLYARIQNDIATLLRESLEQSLDKLSSVNMYYWPGPQPGGGGVLPEELLPLAAQPVGVDDVFEVLCSNRRVVKVLDELSRLDKSSATALVNKELPLALEQYMSFYGELFDEAQRRYAIHENSAPVRHGLLLYGEDPNGKTVLLGSRNKLLSLVFIAANLHLDGCSSQIRKVVDQALEQRQLLYENKAIDEFIRYDLLTRASLYERQVLATGILDTSPPKARRQEAMDRGHVVRKEQVLTKFDAATSPFDFYVRHGVMGPDYSHGEIKVSILSPMTDEIFDAIVK